MLFLLFGKNFWKRVHLWSQLRYPQQDPQQNSFLKALFQPFLGDKWTGSLLFGYSDSTRQTTSFAVQLSSKVTQSSEARLRFEGLRFFCWVEAVEFVLSQKTQPLPMIIGQKEKIMFVSTVFKRLIEINREETLFVFEKELKELSFGKEFQFKFSITFFVELGLLLPNFLPLIFKKLQQTLISIDSSLTKNGSSKTEADFCSRVIFMIISKAANSEATKCGMDAFLSYTRTCLLSNEIPCDDRRNILNQVFNTFFEQVIKLDKPRCSQFPMLFLAKMETKMNSEESFESPAQKFLHLLVAGLFNKHLSPRLKAKHLAFIYSFFRVSKSKSEIIFPVLMRLLSYLTGLLKKLEAKKESSSEETFSLIVDACPLNALLFYFEKIVRENLQELGNEQTLKLSKNLQIMTSLQENLIAQFIKKSLSVRTLLSKMNQIFRNKQIESLLIRFAQEESNKILFMKQNSMESIKSNSSKLNVLEDLEKQFVPFEKCSLPFYTSFFKEEKKIIMHPNCNMSHLETDLSFIFSPTGRNQSFD